MRSTGSPRVDVTRPRRPAQRVLLTVSQFSQKHPAFSVPSLRWLLFHRKTNGFDKAVLNVGRRVLIDEERWFQVIDEQNGQ